MSAQGEWSRLDYMTKAMQGPGAVVAEVKAILPAGAHSIYYRDGIGNISTSHVRSSLRDVEVTLRPRFPLLGGWKVCPPNPPCHPPPLPPTHLIVCVQKLCTRHRMHAGPHGPSPAMANGPRRQQGCMSPLQYLVPCQASRDSGRACVCVIWQACDSGLLTCHSFSCILRSGNACAAAGGVHLWVQPATGARREKAVHRAV